MLKVLAENQSLQFQYELMTETASQFKEKLRTITGDRSLTLNNNQDRSTIKLTKMSSLASLNETNDKISTIEQYPKFGTSSQPQGIYLEHNQSGSFSTGINNCQVEADSPFHEKGISLLLSPTSL